MQAFRDRSFCLVPSQYATFKISRSFTFKIALIYKFMRRPICATHRDD